MASPPQPPPGAVVLSDLMPQRQAARLGISTGVRWAIVLAYGALLLIMLPRQISRYHGSAFGLAVGIFFSLACSLTIVIGMLLVVPSNAKRLARGVHSWLEGSTLVVYGAGEGRCDLAVSEARIVRQQSDAATITAAHPSAPVLVVGPDGAGRSLRYLLGEPLVGSQRPPSDLLALAAVLEHASTESGRAVARELRNLASTRRP